MFEHFSSRLRAAGLLAVAVLAFTAAPVLARPRGGHGARGGGHVTVRAFRGGAFRGGAFRGGWHAGSRGWAGFRGFGYSPYWGGYGWPSYYYGYPYSSYYYGYPDPSYYYGGYPYTNYDNLYPASTGASVSVADVAPIDTDAPTSATAQDNPPAAPVPDNRAHVVVRVPANAEVWFATHRTTQTGTTRTFTSPPLTPGKEYAYTVRARWMTDSGPQEQTRTVEVEANRTAEVAFPETVAEELPLAPVTD